MPPNRKPLVVIIHIPKTGGTTLNSALNTWSSNGLTHCEAIIRKPEELKIQAGRLDWISGHVGFGEMRAALTAATDRALKFYSILRNPMDQVASHYNWLMEIYHRGGDFYHNHSVVARRISEEIRKTDNRDPEEIIRLLKKRRKLFKNQQSRLILGDMAARPRRADVLARLKEFEAIATNTHIQTILGQITNRAFTAVTSENQSDYHFDRAVFQSQRMQSFLKQYIREDLRLFATVQELEAGQAAPGSPPI